jgi:hypothetical protein
MTMQIILIFQAIQAFSLMVIALSTYNIWKKMEWEPQIEYPVKPREEEKPQQAQWQTAEKKFRAKVYEE